MQWTNGDGSEQPPGRSGEVALRADAQRKREQIVVAALAMFTEHGLDTPLEAIASAAGVGIATLYRRFPTRADLIGATFERKIFDYTHAVDVAAAESDPWVGFCGLINRLCALQAGDAALKDLLTMTFPEGSQVEQVKDVAQRKVEVLVQRARRQGVLRADFEVSDITLLLLANAGLVTATRQHAPDAWRRLAAYMIDAFRADHAHALPLAVDYERLSRSKVASRL